MISLVTLYYKNVFLMDHMLSWDLGSILISIAIFFVGVHCQRKIIFPISSNKQYAWPL